MRNVGELPAVIDHLSIRVYAMATLLPVLKPSANYTIILKTNELLTGLNISRWNGTKQWNGTYYYHGFRGDICNLSPPFTQNYILNPAFKIMPYDEESIGLFIDTDCSPDTSFHRIKITFYYDNKSVTSEFINLIILKAG